MFIQILEDKTFVFGIQFRRDEFEDIIDIELILRVISRDVFFLERKDGLLFLNNIL